MKVLVIPDVHLKTYIYEKAALLMKQENIDKAVMLGDIVDDFGKQNDYQAYEEIYDTAIDFIKEYPDTLLCFGNHDAGYLWNREQSGTSYSEMTRRAIYYGTSDLIDSFNNRSQIAIVHRIDNVLFSHAGVGAYFVEDTIAVSKQRDIDYVIDVINSMFFSTDGHDRLWQDDSPIWFRPQGGSGRMFMPRKCLQVVGHTPMEQVTREKNLLSCDVFSTTWYGEPYGSQEFVILDTRTWEYKTVSVDDI